ncbi:ABC-type polysaccharide/polyol phosphate transport system ATPase subunit [Arthrobacter sp. B1I2]|nr:ABC-type polysaccharide/polyol phosphate transport system ATPase subunit [Arthrobacter sp. B1I2]
MPVAIEVHKVNKQFVLRHTRSLKETIVWLFTGRKGDLSKKFHALHDVDLEVQQGETVALLGLNGSGKSTLLKHISGVMLPDTGTVRTRGKVAGLIEVGAGFHHDLSGRDNVYLNGAILGMTEAQINEQFDSIVEFAEIGEFIDTEVRFYSSGMYLRLAFSRWQSTLIQRSSWSTRSLRLAMSRSNANVLTRSSSCLQQARRS